MKFPVAVNIIAIHFLLLLVCPVSGYLIFDYDTNEEFHRDEIYEDEQLRFMIYSTTRLLPNDVQCKRTYKEIIKLEKESQTSSEATFIVTGKRLGIENVVCADTVTGETVDIGVKVLRTQSLIDKFFLPYVLLMVAIFNITFGTEISMNDLRFIMRRPKPLITAAVCQFILLPPLGLSIARLMGYPPDVGLGMFMVACAPGGGDSNAAAYLIDGEVALSIAMTFFSTCIAIGTMPLNLFIYGRFISDDPNWTPEDIPYERLVMTLVILAVPVSIGMFCRSKWPQGTDRVMKFGKPVIFILLMIFICMAIVRNLFAFELVGVKDIAGSCLQPLGGFLLGGIASAIMRLRFSQFKTVALEVGMQNAGIVISMSLVAFQQPKADLNGILPIFMALCQTAVTAPIVMTHGLVYKCSAKYRNVCKRNKEEYLGERETFEAERKLNVDGRATPFEKDEEPHQNGVGKLQEETA